MDPYDDEIIYTSRVELIGKKISLELKDHDTMHIEIRAREDLSNQDIVIKVEYESEEMNPVTPATALGIVFIVLFWFADAIFLCYNSCCRKKKK